MRPSKPFHPCTGLTPILRKTRTITTSLTPQDLKNFTSVLERFKDNYPNETFQLDGIYFYDFDESWDRVVFGYDVDEGPNPQYEAQLKQYNEALVFYEEEIKTYEARVREWEIQRARETLKRHNATLND